ncbi:MAG: high-potential iron-sulfur protein [Bacteriovoracia bacterium]
MHFNRRSFLKYLGLGIASVPLLGKIPSVAFAADLPMAKETDPMPKSLKFCLDADKPSKSCPDRKKAEKKDEYCHNCQLFTKTSGDGKAAIGKCMLMTKNTVPGHGWCSSWVKKA